MKGVVLERVKEFAKAQNLNSAEALANAIGMSSNTLRCQFNGSRALSLDTTIALLDAFAPLSAEWLMRGVGPMQLQSGVGNSTINIQKQGAHAINAGGSVNAPSSNDAEVVKRLMDQMDGLRAELSALRAQNEKLTNKLLGL